MRPTVEVWFVVLPFMHTCVWCPRLLSTFSDLWVHGLFSVFRVWCPEPPGSCSPVCALRALCCVCGVLVPHAIVWEQNLESTCSQYTGHSTCSIKRSTMLIFLKGLSAFPMHTKLTVQQCAIRGKAPNQAPTKGEDKLCNECPSGSFRTTQE